MIRSKNKYHNFLSILVVSMVLLACSDPPNWEEVGAAKAVTLPPEEVEVYRTIMPDAGPSAFAVRFNGEGVALCYDPVRGGINYVWKGDFDLKPTLAGKIPKPASVEGEPFYEEKEWYPLRTSKTVKKPVYRFRGYSLKEGIPEFRYAIDGGLNILERISATKEGGIRRDFEVQRKDALPNSLYLYIGAQDAATVSVSGESTLEGDWVVFRADPIRSFTVTIQQRKGGEL